MYTPTTQADETKETFFRLVEGVVNVRVCWYQVSTLDRKLHFLYDLYDTSYLGLPYQQIAAPISRPWLHLRRRRSLLTPSNAPRW